MPWRVWRSAVAACGSGLCIAAAVAVPVLASTDDQDRLDAAMEEFNERMADEGWESQGLPDDATEGTSSEDEDEELSPSDEQFLECVGDMAAIFPSTSSDDFPGQTALSYSDEFTFMPPSAATQTTEAFSFDVEQESVAAFAASVDDENVGNLAVFVEALGDKATGDCIYEALQAEVASDAADSEIPVEFEIDVENEPSLGIGDGSSRLSFSMATNLLGIPFEFDAGVFLTHVGNDIVGITYVSTGDPTSGLEPEAELRTLVESIGG